MGDYPSYPVSRPPPGVSSPRTPTGHQYGFGQQGLDSSIHSLGFGYHSSSAYSSVTSPSFVGQSPSYLSSPFIPNQQTQSSHHLVGANETAEVGSHLQTDNFGGSLPSLRSCRRCTSCNVELVKAEYGHRHDASTELEVLNPWPDQVSAAINFMPEWTFMTFQCRNSGQKYCLYRYHLGNYETCKPEPEIGNAPLAGLLGKLRNIFDASPPLATQQAFTNFSQDWTSSHADTAESSLQQSVPSQEAHTTHAANATSNDIGVQQPLLGSLADSDPNNRQIPQNNLGIRSYNASAEAYGYNGLSAGGGYSRSETSAYQPIAPGQQLAPSFTQTDDLAGQVTGGAAKNSRAKAPKQARRPRQMDHEKYGRNRARGTCKFSRQRHIRCDCEEGGLTCEELKKSG